MAKAYNGEDLLRDPECTENGDRPSPVMQTPYDQAIDLLATTSGHRLEMMCRLNPPIRLAAAVAYVVDAKFNCRFIRGMVDQALRLSVGESGQGRQEIVQSLQSGSGVTDGFYQASTPGGFE